MNLKLLLPLLALSIFYVSIASMAGMVGYGQYDFSMDSHWNERVPVFYSIQHGVDWVRSLSITDKEKAISKVHGRINALRLLLKSRDSEFTKRQLYYVSLVLGLLEYYKDNPDAAMIYVIPAFKSEDDAIRYATKAKWIEPLLQQMIAHRDMLRINSDDPSVGWLLKHQSPIGNIYYEQWKYVDIAVRIMINFKKKGIKGDQSMVGSSIYAGSYPIRSVK